MISYPLELWTKNCFSNKKKGPKKTRRALAPTARYLVRTYVRALILPFARETICTWYPPSSVQIIILLYQPERRSDYEYKAEGIAQNMNHESNVSSATACTINISSSQVTNTSNTNNTAGCLSIDSSSYITTTTADNSIDNINSSFYSVKEETKVECQNCQKETQKPLPNSNRYHCSLQYDAVQRCMKDHHGQVSSCKIPWEEFRSCHNNKNNSKRETWCIILKLWFLKKIEYSIKLGGFKKLNFSVFFFFFSKTALFLLHLLPYALM